MPCICASCEGTPCIDASGGSPVWVRASCCANLFSLASMAILSRSYSPLSSCSISGVGMPGGAVGSTPGANPGCPGVLPSWEAALEPGTDAEGISPGGGVAGTPEPSIIASSAAGSSCCFASSSSQTDFTYDWSPSVTISEQPAKEHCSSSPHVGAEPVCDFWKHSKAHPTTELAAGVSTGAWICPTSG